MKNILSGEAFSGREERGDMAEAHRRATPPSVTSGDTTRRHSALSGIGDENHV